MPERPLLLVPLGSTEQHGPHLPTDTDTVIARAVTRGVAAALPGSVVAPALAIGASGEHQGFPGTLSIGTDALALVLVELVRSAALWAGRIVFVTGHGGNADALVRAVGQLRDEGHDVQWGSCGLPGGDAHAGRFETSLMLHLAPGDVRLELAAAGDARPIRELMPALVAGGVRSVSPNGVLGDPTGASAEEGAALLAALIEAALARIGAA